MFPCRLRRQPCLVGAEFAKRLQMKAGDNMNGLLEPQDLVWDTDARTDASSTTSLTETLSQDEPAKPDATLTISLFESIITSYPPILESLLAQIPTASLLDLYHTSNYLRNFLREYPLAWRTLSFRLPQPAVVVGTPGNETPDSKERQSKAYSFDALLKQVIQPYGSRLTSLDVCNTAVTGLALSQVLQARVGTLQHLSVRGCKNVSIKYHIVPFLEPYTYKSPAWNPKDLALKSIYTYRCRHHRRRPYLPSSLIRRDSDSDPTHQLIEICHQLGIWTDTSWCPTPGGRCFRRKDYHAGRAGPQNMEVWVPFDRLWRSSNRIGPMDGGGNKLGTTDGRLWEISETGQDGEPLGTESGQSKGEGKHVPAHLRKSHKVFLEDVKCAQCSETILERCESCSVRMHCMGCRKTLCASCAFNRPIPRKRVKTRHFANLAFGAGVNIGNSFGQGGSSSSLDTHSRAAQSQQSTNRFWWAPGATRSPNLMNENVQDDDSSDSDDVANLNGPIMPQLNRDPPKLNMHWCCLEPIFSGGGGIAVLGTGLGGRGADKIRAAPLPRTKEFEDPDFSNHLRPVDYVRELKNNGLYEYVLGEDVDVLSYLKQDSLDLQAETCPRALCQDCYRSFRWKVSCRTCKTSLCKEHDFRGLKFRKCGYRDMHTEREYVRTHNDTPRLVIPDFNPRRGLQKDPDQTPTASSLEFESSIGSVIPDPEPAESSMSQSQILTTPTQPTAPEMSATTSQSSHISTTDPFANPSLPFIPVSSSRPRSFSASGVRGRNSGSWTAGLRGGPVNTISNPLPLPCNPRHPVQWDGCGAYFCQSSRPVGDNRTQCPALLKECVDCAVLVCDSCTANNPSCTCTFCTLNFHCPFCARKKENRAQCRFEEEQRAREAAELRARQRLEKEMADRGQADNVAGAAYEFWALMGEMMEEMIDRAEMEHTIAELPAPSPDSITVTTEFGVHEEPSNYTVISASGPPPTESPIGLDQFLPDPLDLDMLMQSAPDFIPNNPMNPNLSSALLFTLQNGSVSADNADEEGEDADFEDEDDLDAESALIDEFIDDGALTPTTTTTAEQN